MPPKGWKRGADGTWYDPLGFAFQLPKREPAESDEMPDDPEPEQCDRGQSLTKISPKQRKFAKGN